MHRHFNIHHSSLQAQKLDGCERKGLISSKIYCLILIQIECTSLPFKNIIQGHKNRTLQRRKGAK